MPNKTFTFTKPPSYRSSQSCGTCKHWSWGYEGEGDCKKHPAMVHINDLYEDIYDGDVSTNICDDWEEGKEE